MSDDKNDDIIFEVEDTGGTHRDCPCGSQENHDRRSLEFLSQLPEEQRYATAKNIAARFDARAAITELLIKLVKENRAVFMEHSVALEFAVLLKSKRGQSPVPIVVRNGDIKDLVQLGFFLNEGRKMFLNDQITSDISIMVDIGGAISRTKWLESPEALELAALYGDGTEKEGNLDNQDNSANPV